MTVDHKIEKLFDSFAGMHVLVIGDVMLDAYIWGDVERISPEAPVPIVSVKKRENRLGGAANVALNLKALGATPVLCSVIGRDERSADFVQLLNDSGLTSDSLVRSNTRKTTTKFRIIGNNVQLLRVDDEITEDINTKEQDELLNNIRLLIENGQADVILFQDYDKGVITPELIEKVVQLANRHHIPVAVDPKKNNFLHYKNVTLFKPNLKEIKEGLNKDFDATDMQAIEQAVSELQDLLQADIVMNTLSEGGIFTRWKENGKIYTAHHKAHVRSIADVSGAGDTVISVAALGLATKLNPSELSAMANLAGGLVCEEVGVVPINKERLKKEMINAHVLG